MARDWCWPGAGARHWRHGVLDALLVPDGAGSQPGRALGALLGTLQAWQGSPGWLRWAALRLPAASPSLAEVLRAGINNAFLIGFSSPFKVVTALDLIFLPFDSWPD